MSKKYVIFGAGKDGKEIYSHLNACDIAYFCDNNNEKVGTKIYGIEVISFSQLLKIWRDYTIILAISDKCHIRRQFERNGITEYIEYWNDKEKNRCIPNNVMQNVKENTEKNHLLDQYANECDKINPIDDFYEFRELAVSLKKQLNGQYAFYDSKYQESISYGHAKAIMDYAEIKIDYANFPCVAHGLFFAGTHNDFRSAAIYSGMYDKIAHNNRYPYVPVFAIGPYIQYASSIYTKQQITEMKEKNGKTAVIFLSHSSEMNPAIYDEKKIVDEIISVYPKQYSSVWVCAYWCDIDKEIYSNLLKNGIKVVSAGLRCDMNFIRRVRTIFELGDDIYAYGFTSAVGYALSLKKNLYVYNCEEKFEFHNVPQYVPFITLMHTHEYSDITNILFNKMRGEMDSLTETEKHLLDLHFGLNIKKTPQEIRKIYEVSCDIWNNCLHIDRDYPIGVYKTFLQYQREYDMDKLNVLAQGLGKGFWNI